ncbi:hypothetical protein FPSE5266_20184 [Fusarium pseudograminearum]|nr:hypothetical protein FPSE5266_20184 [Fusarium pseudograminearum]
MRTREKIGVGIALTFGIFAAAAAGAKCFGMLGLSSPNRTLDRAGIFIWSTVEISVTIMAASIPIMRILVLRGKDYKMCSKGRKENKWGACGMSAVEMRPIPDGTCGECLKKQKKK